MVILDEVIDKIIDEEVIVYVDRDFFFLAILS